ncbi:hypothetical protein PUV54_07410 [Hyphococcus flavus]|uniref:Uncharacterized protein n=1 Tax=Hyphococcus flavus TaxID=1866326 RepID=A0AAE9ZDG3_9PROT|nr:hypothetical protein [Hyphococcus flavus]WDI33023.1 hypothetical protein PUV54_07410 [Hyphococcus flavus]
MSDQSLQTRLAAIGADGFVSADEVLFMRRTVFSDGVVSPEELDALFDLGDRAQDGDAEWFQFFAEAAADFYLREEEPQGYLTPDEFQSLKARVTRNGFANPLELALMVKLMETAEMTPPEMSAFVGEQFKNHILGKEDGPVVSKQDAVLLRRYLFAAGGDGNVAITRREAELLFDINDATENARNNPAWTELFVQGVINHLMAHLGYKAPSREEAFRRNAWAKDQSVNVGGFFKRMVSGGVGAVIDAYSQKPVQSEHNATRERDAAIAADVTENEADWLAARIGRDGAFDVNERRLLERMRDLEKELPEGLKALLERAA